eukprot:RCo049080
MFQRAAQRAALRPSLGRRHLITGKPLHIVVGLSGTKYGDLAIKAAVEYSRDVDKITGIYIPPTLPREAPAMVQEDFAKYRDTKTKEVLQRAAKLSEEVLKNSGSKASFAIKEIAGTASRKVALVQACFDLDADLLVLGSKGLMAELSEATGTSGPAKADVSSTPHYAMHNAPCPVLVVKP